MQIRRKQSGEGTLYEVFRSSHQNATVAAMQILAYARKERLNTLINDESSSGFIMAIGPLQGAADVAFRTRWAQFIDEAPSHRLA